MSVQKQMRERIARARKEAGRLSVVLRNPYAAADCHNVDSTSATIVYAHGGRVYHAVVYDMGTIEQYDAEIGDAVVPATETLTVPSSELRVGDRLVEWSLGGQIWHSIRAAHGTGTARILEIRTDDMRTDAGTFELGGGANYQWKIERTVQP